MIAVIGLLIGVILGFVLDVNISDKFSPYMSVAILACLDSVFGAIRANLSKTFQPDIFISGFFGNALLAALLKNRALSIIGLIVSVLIFVALVGFIFFVLYAVCAITHVVLVSKHKKALRGF